MFSKRHCRGQSCLNAETEERESNTYIYPMAFLVQEMAESTDECIDEVVEEDEEVPLMEIDEEKHTE